MPELKCYANAPGISLVCFSVVFTSDEANLSYLVWSLFEKISDNWIIVRSEMH